MKNPRVVIDLTAFSKNVAAITSYLNENGIEVAAVTKAFLADRKLSEIYSRSSIKYLADSRLENLAAIEDLPQDKMMLRLPMISEAEEVVRYCQVSLNSEIETIRALNEAAMKAGIKHRIIFMADLGDLREGYIDEAELMEAVEETLKLSNIEIEGIGANLTCYGGVIPDENNLNHLLELKDRVEKRFNIELPVVSGGNSSSLHLLADGRMPEGINNLRIGEGFLLGRETAHGEQIPGTSDEVFTLVAEIVEIKVKPTVPIGKIGLNAFGEVPHFEDRGERRTAICAIGKQDIDISKMDPLDNEIIILGASSDHLLIDINDSKEDYRIGSEVRFRLSYGGVLSALTSRYVKTDYIE